MFFKFWSYVLGYLVVKVEGVALEKFVNMAISRGIYLWDITLHGDELFIKVRVNSFKTLRHVAKKIGCRISIAEKKGFPFIAAYFQKRKMLVAGAVTCLLTIYLLSSFIWFVEIQGLQKLPRQQILSSLKQAGLEKGTPKWEIDTKEIEKQVGKQIHELAWVGITIKGTKAIVEVVEKKLPSVDANDKEPAHIVADKKGVIKEILVMTGEGVVKEGQLVKKGQVLISGIVLPSEQQLIIQPGEEEEIESRKPRYVHAKGIVKARVWYQVAGTTKIQQTKYKPTGNTLSNLRIKIGSKEIILKGPEEVPYKHYSKEEKVNRFLKWRNINVPVEVISTTYNETTGIKLNLGYEKAKNMAIEAAENEIMKKLAPSAEILNKEVEEIKVQDSNTVKFKVTVEAVENIGKLRYIRKDSTN